MKILVVNNYYPEHFGGIEFIAHNLVTRYRQAGHEVRWMATDVPDHPHLCHTDDVPLHAWNFTEEKLGFPYPILYPNSINTISKQVRWCDVIHLHDCLYLSNIIVFLFSRLMRKPVLLTQHVKILPYKQFYKRFLQSLAYRSLGSWLLSRAEQVTFYSLTVRDWFSRFVSFRAPSHFIPNGVDINVFHPNKPEDIWAFRQMLGIKLDTPLFLFVGRFVEKKSIRLLRPIIENNPDWFWILIGRPDDEDPATWQLPNMRVVPPMPQEQLQSYYTSANLLVLPSVGEGFPLSAQESMACGTPVLLCEETLQALPEGHKLFISSHPDTATLQRQLRQVVKNLSTLEELRPHCRQFAWEEWSWEVTSRRYQTIFDTIIY